MSERIMHYYRPVHYDMRSQVAPHSTPSAVLRWRDLVRTTVRNLLDGVEVAGRMDVIQELLRADPEGLAASATEECLRYDSPVAGVGVVRVARKDAQVGEKTVPQGDRVCVILSAPTGTP